ncbi:Heat shock factor protein 3 [Choanephora cucurbitarum]|uniref:Heat shock factor protein 3 n=1 Tax=Choanephora cucurbitarum TaxID=101091 RepID=A0A1C7N5E1_9FUNG|nr:Heat shock factor protein 3 [Choanephora cucurbitarum]
MLEYPGISKQRPLPSFIKKLWLILATESFKEFIFWVDQGQVICVPNAVLFSQNILPKFFKHNNWQSFVRQLNLYGFRKVYQLNLAYDESLEKRIVWQFKHDHFQRDHPELLCEIKRRTTRVIRQQKQDEELQAQQDKSEEDDYDDENETDSKRFKSNRHEDAFQEELQQLKLKLEHTESERQELWRQTIELSKRQSDQQKTINAVSDFIHELIIKNPQLTYDQIQLDRIGKEGGMPII